MKSFDYEGVSTSDGEAVCLDCLDGDPNSEEFYPIFADSEWDYYPCCAYCFKSFDYVNLTREGQIYYKRCDNCGEDTHRNPDYTKGYHEIVVDSKSVSFVCDACLLEKSENKSILLLKPEFIQQLLQLHGHLYQMSINDSFLNDPAQLKKFKTMSDTINTIFLKLELDIDSCY